MLTTGSSGPHASPLQSIENVIRALRGLGVAECVKRQLVRSGPPSQPSARTLHVRAYLRWNYIEVRVFLRRPATAS
jgi:hypothetical protein